MEKYAYKINFSFTFSITLQLYELIVTAEYTYGNIKVPRIYHPDDFHPRHLLQMKQQSLKLKCEKMTERYLNLFLKVRYNQITNLLLILRNGLTMNEKSKQLT